MLDIFNSSNSFTDNETILLFLPRTQLLDEANNAAAIAMLPGEYKDGNGNPLNPEKTYVLYDAERFSSIDILTLAHELGHTLSLLGDANHAVYFLFPDNNQFSPNWTPAFNRRISKATEVLSRSHPKLIHEF